MPAKSPKYQEAEKRLPEALKPVFAKFVEEYEFLTQMHYGRGYVAYVVLADLVRAGWRSADKPTEDSPL